jgi:hypothetical protein
MADPMTNYAGGPRHAPAPNIRPMSQSDVGGTSSILNSAGRSRPRRGAVGQLGSVPSIAGPLRTDTENILKSAGLGRRTPVQKSAGEQMSDASEDRGYAGSPVDPDNPHPLMSRMRDALSIRGGESAPVPNRTLGDYPNLDYSPMTMPEMRQRMGLPADFSGRADDASMAGRP